MALGNKSGDQVGLIHEKNQKSKISWDYPFKKLVEHLQTEFESAWAEYDCLVGTEDEWWGGGDTDIESGFCFNRC